MKKEAISSLENTKFQRRATEDSESICSSDEEIDFRAILIGKISISLNCSTTSLTLQKIFKSKEKEESLVEVKEKQFTTNEDHIYKGINIESSRGSRP